MLFPAQGPLGAGSPNLPVLIRNGMACVLGPTAVSTQLQLVLPVPSMADVEKLDIDLRSMEIQVQWLPSMIRQRQSITQKGVHARSLTAREREHWFLQHLSHFTAVNFGRQ